MNTIKCIFCEKEKDEKEIIVAKDNVNICRDCSNDVHSWFESKTTTPIVEYNNDFPFKKFQIKAYMDRYVVGQEEAKKVLCTTVLYHFLRTNSTEAKNTRKSNLLMVGPSGSGKTYMIEKLLSKLQIPYVIEDSSSLVSSGIVGKSVDDCVRDLYLSANMSTKKAEKGIIVFDEIDKLQNKYGVVSQTGVQQELLKIIEGRTVDISSRWQFQFSSNRFGDNIVDTKDVTFIFLGAFSSLYSRISSGLSFSFTQETDSSKSSPKISMKDIVSFGFMQEMVGRINNVVSLSYLGMEEIKKILIGTDNPVISDFKFYFSSFGIKLDVTNAGAESIVKTSKYDAFGSRALKSTLSNVLNQYMFDVEQLQSNGVKSILVDSKDDKIVVTTSKQES